MADPIWRSKNFFILYLNVKLDKGVLGVTDYEFVVGFRKFYESKKGGSNMVVGKLFILYPYLKLYQGVFGVADYKCAVGF